MAIVLEKSGDSHRINLEKRAKAAGEIKINLDWSKGHGLLKRIFGGGEIDLDLGCYYELRDGSKLLIDGLQFAHNQGGPRDEQSRQGCLTKPPYIWHMGDDRGTESQSGETILVNPDHTADIKRIIVYTFIYEGAARWAETNAVVRVSVPGCEDVIVELGKQSTDKRFCAICAININPDNTMDVQKLVTFHNGHSDCDLRYGWGFKYHEGRK